jgi:hypothetical protein
MPGDHHPHLKQIESDHTKGHSDGHQSQTQPKELDLRNPGFENMSTDIGIDKVAANSSNFTNGFSYKN